MLIELFAAVDVFPILASALIFGGRVADEIALFTLHNPATLDFKKRVYTRRRVQQDIELVAEVFDCDFHYLLTGLRAARRPLRTLLSNLSSKKIIWSSSSCASSIKF